MFFQKISPLCFLFSLFFILLLLSLASSASSISSALPSSRSPLRSPPPLPHVAAFIEGWKIPLFLLRIWHLITTVSSQFSRASITARVSAFPRFELCCLSLSAASMEASDAAEICLPRQKKKWKKQIFAASGFLPDAANKPLPRQRLPSTRQRMTN